MPPTPPAMKAFVPPADLTSSSLNSLAPSTSLSLSSCALSLTSWASGWVMEELAEGAGLKAGEAEETLVAGSLDGS